LSWGFDAGWQLAALHLRMHKTMHSKDAVLMLVGRFAIPSACGSYLYIYVKGIYNAQKTSRAVFVLVLMQSAGFVLGF